ncbi:hypothetical protein BQ8794_30269 [Mesorhizobium prunaredense]|uniref:Uncharacterized protein n=1 Tax=Mesorhizobium prunaredense TaxID=1631249 RepID=A0A1R3VA81_9HYPH|nr:hypothetical protein BQ8794_30269 [Mesorhizobium prunaredense]
MKGPNSERRPGLKSPLPLVEIGNVLPQLFGAHLRERNLIVSPSFNHGRQSARTRDGYPGDCSKFLCHDRCARLG